jgi:hypothetical protein
LIGEDVLETSQQELPIIWLDDEVIHSTLQVANYIPRVGTRGQQDHWNMGKVRITLDLLAELVAVHLRHEDIADDSGWPMLTHKSDAITAVLGH